ncbi:MAG TPA: hypothetical protein VLS89_21035, partial [Candidatus Nanopelagicales bacterium]|nr:hypothetical protein [Candidatus Nanopelagicales bacterium]
TVLNDPLPAGVTYVPGSLAITSGANAGAKTDATGDDQGEYLSGTNTVRVRLGTGADATQGGTMVVGATAVVTFQVTVDASATGTISNQAIITAAGEQGAPQDDTPTDGNGPAGGAPPTEIEVTQDGTGGNGGNGNAGGAAGSGGAGGIADSGGTGGAADSGGAGGIADSGGAGVGPTTTSSPSASPAPETRKPINFYACTSSPLVPPYPSPAPALLLAALAALASRRRQAP